MVVCLLVFHYILKWRLHFYASIGAFASSIINLLLLLQEKSPVYDYADKPPLPAYDYADKENFQHILILTFIDMFNNHSHKYVHMVHTYMVLDHLTFGAISITIRVHKT